MMIEVTDKFIAIARDASIAIRGYCSTYDETKASLEAVFAEVEKDYVPRWGWIREAVPREALLNNENVIPWIQEMVQERAKRMGGTIEDVTKFEIEEEFSCFGSDQVVLKWRVRRG